MVAATIDIIIVAVQISTTLNGRCLTLGGSVDGLLIDLALASVINVSIFKTGRGSVSASCFEFVSAIDTRFLAVSYTHLTLPTKRIV